MAISLKINSHRQCFTVFYKYTNVTVKSFLPHSFVKKKQDKSYKIDKDTAQKDDSTMMMLHIDCVENFTCSAQD